MSLSISNSFPGPGRSKFGLPLPSANVTVPHRCRYSQMEDFMKKSIKTLIPKRIRQKLSRKQHQESKTKPEHRFMQVRAAAKDKKTVVPASGKLTSMIAMLRRTKGASIAELCAATGWQAHSVRGALSGAIKKKQGLTITSEKSDGVRIYRVTN